MLPVITVAPPDSLVSGSSDKPDPFGVGSVFLFLALGVLLIGIAFVGFGLAAAENLDCIHCCHSHFGQSLVCFVARRCYFVFGVCVYLSSLGRTDFAVIFVRMV